MTDFNRKCPLFDSSIVPAQWLKMNDAGDKIVSSSVIVPTLNSDLGLHIPGGTTQADVEAAITATGAGTLYLFPGLTYNITDNLTIPNNVTVYIPRGALFNISSGKVLTFNGQLDAGLYQIFSGTGTVTGLSEAYPEWWATNTTPGTTDMTAAFEAAITSVHPGAIDSSPFQGGTVYFSRDKYRTSTMIDMTYIAHVKLKGVFSYPAMAENINYGTEIINTTSTIFRLGSSDTIEGIYFSGFTGNTNPMIEVYDLDNHIVDCGFSDMNTAIKVIGLPVAGKTGSAIIERNYFFHGLTDAGQIILDTTNADIPYTHIRDNHFVVNSALGYTGEVGIKTTGTGYWSASQCTGNHFENFGIAGSKAIQVNKGRGLVMHTNSFIGVAGVGSYAYDLTDVVASHIGPDDYYGCGNGILATGVINSVIDVGYQNGTITDWITFGTGTTRNTIYMPNASTVYSGADSVNNGGMWPGGIWRLLSSNFSTFLMDAAGGKTINNDKVTAETIIILAPLNAAATALQRGIHALRHDSSANVVGTSFTVRTEDAAAAAGTEVFGYFIMN